MSGNEDISKYLPLSESTFCVLVALLKPLHGYGVMQKVAKISEGTVEVGPGKLYGAFSTLEKEGLILKVKEEGRRKCYQLTARGRQVLQARVRRVEIMARVGKAALAGPR